MLNKTINVIKNKKFLFLFMVFILILIIVLINFFSVGNITKNSKLENELKNKAYNFVTSNNLYIDEKGIFLSFDVLNYKIESKCSKNGGVYVKKESSDYSYLYYYSCNKYVSDEIRNIQKSNDKLSEFLVLYNDNPIYLDKENYFEAGYYLKKGKLNITDNVKKENGVYYVNYDISYNDKKYTLKRIVIVEEFNLEQLKTKPNIILLGSKNIKLKVGESYVEPGYVANDNLDGDITKRVVVTTDLDINKEGSYEISYKVSNSKNYTTIVTRNVIVEKLSVPTITILGNNPVNIKVGESYIEPGFSATDEKDGDITDKVIVTNNVDINKEGSYEVKYTVSNSDNQTVTIIRNVIIEKVNIPVINLKGNASIILSLGESYVEPGFSATDEKDGDITDKVIVTNSVNINKEGTYEVKYRVSNSDNETVEVVRKVIVKKLSIPKITLKGSNTITLKYKEKYIEPGFSAYDEKDGDITNKVKVSNNININKAGKYQVIYTVSNSDNQVVEVKREVVVENLSIPKITLNGSDTITLKYGEKYIEPGFSAYDEKDGNITDKVKVSSNINSNKSGNYTVTYNVTNSSNQSVTITRSVIVEKSQFTYKVSLSTTKQTNSNVTINITVSGDGYSHTVMPDNSNNYNKQIAYVVTSNGTYTFKLINKDGTSYTENVKVNNIDKELPKGSCVATINMTNTIIDVDASDNISILKYIYMDNDNLIKETTANKITYDSKTSENVSVKIIDSASNSRTINCSIIDNSYLPAIKPSASEKIIKQEETDTLNVYITKVTTQYDWYYITRVWAKKPYYQLNKFDSPEYGEKLYKAKTLLSQAVTTNSLSNKLVIGFNASGFYLKDTYDADSVSKYPAYNKTSVGTLVITNGKVIRNVYDKSYKDWFITGIDKNNKLRIFNDYKTTDSEAKKQWSNSVINSGIRNTFTFASPLVENGVASSNTTSMPEPDYNLYRQAICQVNENNYVLITGYKLKRSELINIMLNLNCETGTNLDGGGSVALLYKSSNSSTIESILDNGRELPEVGYFSE